MENEIWKDIPGYEGKYQVSNFGRVKSFCHKKERILYQNNNRGYMYVGLSHTTKKVHRLVLSTFIGPSDLHCNHKDKNRGNNRIDNLEWVTSKENNDHKLSFGDIVFPRLYDNKKCKKVLVFSDDGSFLFYCPGIVMASIITGIYHGDISRCCNGKIVSNKGFIFRYSGSDIEVTPKHFINQYGKEGNFIKKWNSAIDVKKELGIDNSLIIKCLKGKNKTAGGFIWKYNY